MRRSKFLARKVLCGLLAAGVVGASGSALAESVDIKAGEIKADQATISVGAGELFNNAGTVNASESIEFNGDSFSNNGVISTKVLQINNNKYRWRYYLWCRQCG